MATPEVTKLVEMGFPADKAEKALSITGNKGIEPAMEWLLNHADDQPEPSSSMEIKDDVADNSGNGDKPSDLEAGENPPDAEAKSLKCNDCNKLFQSQLEVEYHATKSGHTNFSESTEEKKPLTEEEKKEQLRLIEEKMKQKRKEREEKEKREELEREKRRIQSGKELSAIKEKMKEDEMKKLVEQRKREKIEDQKARQRVKEQIEADRAARRLKYGDGQVASSTSTNTTTSAPAPAPAPAQVAKPQRDYNETRLQIRLTNGQALTHTFGSKEQLSAVRLYVEMNRTDGSEPFSLMTTFPKKVFSDDDYEAPLEVLGLVPSAVLIVTKKTQFA